jgi:pyridinium-3,5-biscarboxylic acid mononucleotide sulfurtransferase
VNESEKSDHDAADQSADTAIERKQGVLEEILRTMGRVTVALSGGVDSTYLARVAYDILGDKATAVTVLGPMHLSAEITDAREWVQQLGLPHKELVLEEFDLERFDNSHRRCYFCKLTIFEHICRLSRQLGTEYVLDGSNADDTRDYRPGMQALRELGVRSPLLEAGLTKADIRLLSRKLGLPTWDKPAMSCLVTRFPFGEKLTGAKLRRVEKAEVFLRENGFRQIRVRSHENGTLARIEVAPEERTRFFDTAFLDRTDAHYRSLGFTFVSIDTGGYTTGSMNTDTRTGTYTDARIQTRTAVQARKEDTDGPGKTA